MCNPANIIHRDQLGGLAVNELRLVEDRSNDERLFQGKLAWYRLRTGLTLHCSDCVEMHDFTTESKIGPRLNFMLFLEGASQVSYGEHALRVGRPTPRAPYEGVAVALAEPERFRRHAHSGAHIRKLVISLDPSWFETGGLSEQQDFRQVLDFQHQHQHLAIRRWVPSTRLLALAEQLLSPPDYAPMLRNLYLESRCLDIAGEALARLVDSSPQGQAGLRPHEHRRIARLLELLDSGAADDWSLERIAQEIGLNATSLQRQFREAKGTTVFEYQRVRRLQRAREALERDGLSVAQAAWLAGYNSPPNFATAFKRQFGMSPRQARARL